MRRISPLAAPERDATSGRAICDVSPIEVLSGPHLCLLQIWTDEEWNATPESERPALSTYAPGLGWVCARPVKCMN